MKRCKTILLGFLMCLAGASVALTSCHRDEPDEPRVRHNRHTILLYIAAENTMSSYFRDDSLEIVKGLKLLPDTVQVAVFVDIPFGSKLYYGSSRHELMAIKTYDHNVSSTDSAEMEMVLGDVFRFFPAESYGIVFWSHASGWVPSNYKKVRRRTFGIDNGKNKGTRDGNSADQGIQMEITTMANVLSHHPHTNYLFFDACFMQCIEAAYQLRHVTDYVIGSPAEQPANGAPYDQLLPLLAAGDINGALRNYYDYYVTGDGSREYGGAIISAIRTDRLEALAAATRPLIHQLFADRGVIATSNVQRYYPMNGADAFTEYFDIVNLMYKHIDTDIFDEWRRTFDEAVPYQYISRLWYTSTRGLQVVSDPEHCGAVSIFVPSEYYEQKGWNAAFHTYDWYVDAGFNTTNW